MGTLFASTLRALVREKSLFIWSLAFPILMATIFMFMFANLDGRHGVRPRAHRRGGR